MFTFKTPYNVCIEYKNTNIKHDELSLLLNRVDFQHYDTYIGNIINIEVVGSKLQLTKVRLNGQRKNLWINGELSSNFKIGDLVEVEYENIKVKSKQHENVKNTQYWITRIFHKNESKKDV